MTDRNHHRPSALKALAMAAFIGFGVVGLGACGSSDASGVSTVQVTDPVPAPPAGTVPVTVPVTTEPATTVAPVATDPAVSVTDADVAELEKQLDEIDQLLAGIDADLSQD